MWLDFLPDGDTGLIIEIQVEEKYRHTAEIGLALQEDDELQALLAFQTRNQLGFGDQLELLGYRSQRDLVLSFSLQGEGLLGTHLGYRLAATSHRQMPRVFCDGVAINRAEFSDRYLSFDVNVPVRPSALLQVGLRVGNVQTRSRPGLDFAADSARHRQLVGRFVWDDLDSLILPRRGTQLSLGVQRDLRALGATASYWRAELNGRWALPLGRKTVVETRLRYGHSSGELPIYRQFRLGGPELMPGFSRQELWGNYAAAASLGIGYDILRTLRVTPRFGVGNVWNRFDDIVLGDMEFGGGLSLSLATPIGPIRLDYGLAGTGRDTLTFALGFPFSTQLP